MQSNQVRYEAGPYLCDLIEVVSVAAHQVGRGRHDEVQHLTRQDGYERMLPAQRVNEHHETFGDQREFGPVGGQKHHPLLHQDTADDLRGTKPSRSEYMSKCSAEMSSHSDPGLTGLYWLGAKMLLK